MKKMKTIKIISIITVAFTLLIINSCNYAPKKTKQLSEVQQKFDGVFVKTLDGKEFELTKYIDSLSKDKPLVITTTLLFCGGCNSSIKKVADYQRKHPDFEIIALSLDLLSNKAHNNLSKYIANTEEDLVNKLKKLDLGCNIIYNIDSSYTIKVLNGEGYTPQTYIIKNDSIVYYNDAGDYIPYEWEYYLVIDALKSQKKTIVDSIIENNHEVKLTYAFENFKRIGKWERVLNETITKMVGEFSNGKRSGEWKRNYDNGKLESLGNYENGEKTGKWKYYHKNGKLNVIESYDKGKAIGEWKYYYKNGQLGYIINYKNDKKTGEFKSYYENGKPFATGMYNDNKRTGDWKFYHKNGKLKQIGSYDNGKAIGEWKIYYDNGQLQQLKLWDNGKLMDIISCYDRNGTPIDKGTIINGNGTVKNYDEQGKIIDVKTYKDGIIVE